MIRTDLPQDENQVGVIAIGGKPWFVLTDLCRAADIDPRDIAGNLDSDEVCSVRILGAAGNAGLTTVISEPGFYHFIACGDTDKCDACSRVFFGAVSDFMRQREAEKGLPDGTILMTALEGDFHTATAMCKPPVQEADVHDTERAKPDKVDLLSLFDAMGFQVTEESFDDLAFIKNAYRVLKLYQAGLDVAPVSFFGRIEAALGCRFTLVDSCPMRVIERAEIPA